MNTSFKITFTVPHTKLGTVMAYLTEHCGEVALNVERDVPHDKNAPRQAKKSIKNSRAARGLSEEAFTKAITQNGGKATGEMVRDVMKSLGLRTEGFYSARDRLKKAGRIKFSGKDILLTDKVA
jgi:hypothetical protein